MRIENFVFRFGQSSSAENLEITPKRVTIFIGPNNGGKSRALLELQQAIKPITNFKSLVMKDVKLSKITDEEFRQKISKLVKPKLAGESAIEDVVAFEGRGGRQTVHMSILSSGIRSGAQISERQYLADQLLKYFYINLSGIGRLDLANPVQITPVGSTALNTISALWKDDKLREKLNIIIFKAFSQHLVIDPTEAPQIGYKLSTNPPRDNCEKRFDEEAATFFGTAMPLSEASDGTKAFVGLLAEVIAGDPELLFVDEPEAFLHPSLQFVLGQQIAEQTGDNKQVFAATHSSAFLLGCVLSGADVDVIRLTHKTGVSTARHLGATRLKQLMTDPLFRSVGAATALFFESAVIVEGDSDRSFYDEINARMIRFSNSGLQHAAFLNAHNKQTVVNIVSPLREIGIPAAFIMDIDWIKEDGQVWDRYFRAMGAPEGLKESFAAARRSIRSSLESIDIDYKRNGGLSLLSGSSLRAAEAFFDQMEGYGLFTVRSGELESWLPNIHTERTKSKWLVSIFDAMGSNPDDADYLKPDTQDVWAFIGRISEWTANNNRKGMN